MRNLDVILGMDWPSFCKAKVDCEIPKVSLRNPMGRLTSCGCFEKSKNLSYFCNASEEIDE
jgi:hypothetical protein